MYYIFMLVLTILAFLIYGKFENRFDNLEKPMFIILILYCYTIVAGIGAVIL